MAEHLSYEDWTPPKFLQGEDIDVERVKLEFYQRESDNATYRRQKKALNSQIADLRNEVDRLKDDDSESESESTETTSADSSTKGDKSSGKGSGQGPSLNEIRLELALEKGLTKSQAMRLRGDTREELEADAKVYMEEHGITSPSDNDEEEQGSEVVEETEQSTPPPSRAPRRGDVKSGAQTQYQEPSWYDPSKLVDLV